MSLQERIKAFLAGEGSPSLKWTFGGKPVCQSEKQQKEFTRAEHNFTSFRYVHSPIMKENTQVEVKTTKNGDRITCDYITEKGCLTARFQNNHPVGHMVKTVDDLRILTYIEQTSHVVLSDSLGELDYYLDRISINPSPVQRLLEYEMGVESFYYLMQDYPRQMAILMDAMLANYYRECELIASLDVASVRLVENTSTSYISPHFYQVLSVPQLKKAIEIFHNRGLLVSAHMCGLLKQLLPLFKETGMDGIHSATPPPVGDISFEDVYQALGSSFRVEGRLGTTAWMGKTEEEIKEYLRDKICKKRIAESPFILEVHLDGVPSVTYEQFSAVRNALEAIVS